MSSVTGFLLVELEQGGEVPFTEMFGTFALSVGAAVSFSFLLLLIFNLNSEFSASSWN